MLFNFTSLLSANFLLFFWAVGLAAGVYSGLTYGLKEARGAHDWVTLLQK